MLPPPGMGGAPPPLPPAVAGLIDIVGGVPSCGGATAWISNTNRTSRPFFSKAWSNAIPTADSGASFVRALVAVTWPRIFEFFGITTCPFDFTCSVVFATTLSQRMQALVLGAARAQ